MKIDDYFSIQRLADPRVSPDGKWVAYTVATSSLKDDKSESRVWMAPVAGGEARAMTRKGASSSSPRFSPDGKWLAFLSARDEGEGQVWLLNRLGGEAEQLTEIKQGVEGFVWSPDGTRLALLIQDPTPEQAGDSSWVGLKAKTPRPVVVNRLQFKRDYSGYLDRRRTHIHLFDVATKKVTQLTSGDWDEESPAWSPDGRLIAFSSNRDSVDGSYNSDLFIVSTGDTTKGTTTRRLTSGAGPGRQPRLESRRQVDRVHPPALGRADLADLRSGAPRRDSRRGRHAAGAHRRDRAPGVLAPIRARRPERVRDDGGERGAAPASRSAGRRRADSRRRGRALGRRVRPARGRHAW